LQKDYLAAKDQPVSEGSKEKVATFPCGTPVKG
jgi:deoxyhypusine synthase